MTSGNIIVKIVTILLCLCYAEANCRNVPDGTFVANPNDIHRWFYCSRGQVLNEGSCEEFIFDPRKQECVEANDCSDVQDGTFVANPNNVHGWFLCLGGRISEEGTCGDFVFEPIDQTCVEANGNDRNACQGNRNGLLIRDPESVHHFFICFNDESAVHVECPINTFFNFDSQNCENDVNNMHPRPTTRSPPQTPRTTIAARPTQTTTRKQPPTTTRLVTSRLPPQTTRRTTGSTRVSLRPTAPSTTRSGKPPTPTRPRP